MFIRVGNQLVNTVSFGAGPRTLLTFGTWVFGWEAWQCQLELLSRSWHAVAFDHRGCGETVASAESITLDALVKDIFGVMDALSIGRTVLAVESSSAIIALRAVLEQPERFTGLVLVAGTPSLPSQDPATLPRTEAELRTLLDGFIGVCVPAPDHQHLRRWLSNISQRCSLEQANRLSLCVAGQDLTPRLREVQVPTLLIHGSADAVVPVGIAQAMAAELPRNQLAILPESDHVPIITRPEEVAQLIDGFVRHQEA
jgi:pimeloyl-ACP methyl ester carboxylesterase